MPAPESARLRSVDVVDETFLAVPPTVVADTLADRSVWRRYWPDLTLEVYSDRGSEGLRWTVRGALTGSMEIWLEGVLDGTVLHYFLRGDLPPGSRPRGGVHAEAQRRQLAAKTAAFDLKDRLEGYRAPGCSPA